MRKVKLKMEKLKNCHLDSPSEQASNIANTSKQKWKKKKKETHRDMQGIRQKSRSPKSDVEREMALETLVKCDKPISPNMKGHIRTDKSPPTRLHCSYCNVYFNTKVELQTHCRSQDHQTTIMSDEGRDWTHRPPPRGLSAEEYTLCTTYKDTHTCRLGDQCIEAHSDAELVEWQERFEYRAMKLERAREKQLHGASYADQLLERLSQTQHHDTLLCEKSEGIITNMSMEPNLRVSQKPSSHEWVISLHPLTPMRVVSLLHDAHRTHFIISEVTHIVNHRHIHKSYEPENNQEWINTDAEASIYQEQSVHEYKVTISFKTMIYGTFRQAVIFDFGSEPVLMQRLCVDVIPVEDLSALEETKRTILTRSERWCEENVEIIPFDPKPHELSDHDKSILAAYPAPTNENFVLTQTSMEKFPTKSNYQSRLHDLLNIEELAQFDLVARFNIKTTLQITSSYLLLPSTAATAKYSRPGELFGKLEVSSEISEDSHHGRLVLSNCSTILVAPVMDNPKPGGKEILNSSSMSSESEKAEGGGREIMKAKRRIYEVLIEDKTKKEIYLRFSESAVAALRLSDDEEVTVEVQFQLNRLPLCEMHAALDRLPSLDMIFPDVTLEPAIPWSPIKQWGESLDAKLNPKQKEALVAITAPIGLVLPPILIIGPYGTGKTYTLAQGIKQILQEAGSRILICTHSNSAADLYIKEYLHPYVMAGHEEAKPLRIYYRNRWVTTVHPDVQKYCLIENDQSVRRFVMPSEEEILSHRVIVATLNTSRYIASLKLEKGVFSHILIDEAAQAMECEALTPLALAKADTRLVLAGDYMQLSPEVFSKFCEERGLGTSLLERLYDLYAADSPCKIMLVENYRSHSAIIKYTSDLFYDGRLVASGRQTAHPKFHPLTFFTARGEDFQDPNSTAFHNNSEVYEVCEQVGEIINHWPKREWGPVGEGSIGVVTPYADQMVRIRAELRKRKLYKINVERVLNVQGKQFRVIILSTVRTRHTCKAGDEGLDFGFLSNAKLLTTAITRAQSLVAVVGDPVSLCSVGKCRKLWERFLQLCSEAGSLYGISWSALRAQLDGVELKKTYVLNPLAPEFIPRYLYYSPLPPLPVVPAMPPYVSMYPPYIPTYPIHPVMGPQALPYIHQAPMPPQWSPVHYNQASKTQIARPAPGRLGQPLIAPHSLRPAVVTAAPAPYMDPHGYDYQLPPGVLPVYSYQPGSIAHRMPAVRRPTELDHFNRGTYMPALPAPYQNLKQVATPSLLTQPPGMRCSRFGRSLALPTAHLGRVTPQSEGEKSYQFLNNVHFPERQLSSNPSCILSRSTRSQTGTESPLSTQSRESSHSSASDGHGSTQAQLQQQIVTSSSNHPHNELQSQLLSHIRHQPLHQVHPQSNGNVGTEDTPLPTPDVPDVVRIIDDLIGDHSPTKTLNQWSSGESEMGNRVDPIQGMCRSTLESWSGNSPCAMRPPNPNIRHHNASSPWSISSAGVGKIVTVQELEASLHNRHQNHGANFSGSVVSRAPGGPPFCTRDVEKPVVNREMEEQPIRERVEVPPPPGFGGINRLVDPMAQLDLREVNPVGYRTPSLPLYLRRGSRETSSGSVRNSPQNSQTVIPNNNINTSASAVWHSSGDNLNSSVSSHGEFGLRNISCSLGVSPSVALNAHNQDNKTYAGVLRSSLQPSASDKRDDASFSLKDLAEKKMYASNNHLYQYFP
ncbi:probable helicase with zinc finger domain isoform X2 [Procambarus clarkii]|uniref:probable helicase with zinc finger domain isoform X2 n=1 Tax=Procambarus clarkii TaxID=6728 RepID=UPI001E670A57|nr:probable helicase with zinc finger domain isoform X2 [Procambarus clarkii]